MPDPDPAISGAGSVLAGSRSGLRFKRHGHGSVQALIEVLGGAVWIYQGLKFVIFSNHVFYVKMYHAMTEVDGTDI